MRKTRKNSVVCCAWELDSNNSYRAWSKKKTTAIFQNRHFSCLDWIFFTNLKLYHTHFLWQKSFFARQLLPEKIKIFHFEKSSFSKFSPPFKLRNALFFKISQNGKNIKIQKPNFLGVLENLFEWNAVLLHYTYRECLRSAFQAFICRVCFRSFTSQVSQFLIYAKKLLFLICEICF